MKHKVPVAIIAVSMLIASGILFLGGGGAHGGERGLATISQTQPSSGFRLPNETDHTRGNGQAKVAIVEFSDFQCPFCARLHPTLTRITAEDPEVKWVYRHYPLNSHTRAFGAAVASECAAKLGGNEAFWKFADGLFAAQNQLGDALYERLAGASGIQSAELRACMGGKDVAAEVEADLNEVLGAGGRGTPFVVVVTPQGNFMPFSGALPYEQVAALVARAKEN
ncbi:MAG: thioredoxin domain-containing protein [Candidatus Liptonbacteria bacterium]|nr:thioredoxin domain-containing protein [Candidatus Liptonbacteria bacterium]